MKIKFQKYHGCGNDFLICEYNENIDYEVLTKKICNRYIGIGADTLITIDYKNLIVKFYNSDGTEAPMCGNGIRCAAAYLKKNKIISSNTIKLNTYSGIRTVYYMDNELYKINMGSPSYEKKDIDLNYNKNYLFNEEYKYKNKMYNLSALFFTTHHLVVVVDDLNISDEVGKYFCEHPMFLKGINVDFVKILDSETLQMKTYERGCGWTKACGSGATSSVAVLNKKGIIKDNVTVKFEYGEINIIKENDEFYMIGPAVQVSDNIEYNI